MLDSDWPEALTTIDTQALFPRLQLDLPVHRFLSRALPTLCLPALAISQCEEEKLVAFDGDELDRYGYSVDIDGDRLLVPSKHDEETFADQGTLYVYDLIGGSWILDERIIASDAQEGDLLGWAAALDGDYILAGAVFHDGPSAVDQGAAYVWERDGSGWNQRARIPYGTRPRRRRNRPMGNRLRPG